MKKGTITPNGVALEKHEYLTVVTLTELGYNVEIIPPSQTRGARTADIKMNGNEWEMKCPKGQGRWLLENTLKKAAKQSPNVMIDLKRVRIPQAKCLRELEKQFRYAKGVKRLKIIKRRPQARGGVLEFNK